MGVVLAWLCRFKKGVLDSISFYPKPLDDMGQATTKATLQI